MGLVLVDLDGTLLEGASSERRFIAHLVAARRLGPAQAVSALKFLLRHWPRYGWQTAKKNKAYLAGLEVEEVAAVAEAFVRERLEPGLRASLMQCLNQHQRRGDDIALLSGAPEFIVGPLAESLGLTAWRATRCARFGGRFLAEPPVQHAFAEEKLSLARELSAALGAELSDCTAYANSLHDLPLLQRVARPVAVHPDRGLLRAARRAGWEVWPEPESRPDVSAFSGAFRTPH